MTEQYKTVLKLILDHHQEHGYSMTHLEIGKRIGKSRQRVDQIVNALVEKGELRKLKPGLTVPK